MTGLSGLTSHLEEALATLPTLELRAKKVELEGGLPIYETVGITNDLCL